MPAVELRPLAIEDAGTIASWAHDEEFCRAADWSSGRGHDYYLTWARRFIREPTSALMRVGVVHHGRLVGYVDLHGEQRDRRELGYLIGERSSWGRGLGTAAAAAGLRLGFADLGLAEIWAEALDANEASVRILQQLGMRETGVVAAASLYLGEPTFYRRYAMRVDEYRTLLG